MSTVPQLLQLLEDNNKGVRDTGVSIMVNLAEHSKFHRLFQFKHHLCRFKAELRAVIGSAIPQLLQLLKDDNDIRVTGANIIAKLTIYGEF